MSIMMKRRFNMETKMYDFYEPQPTYQDGRLLPKIWWENYADHYVGDLYFNVNYKLEPEKYEEYIRNFDRALGSFITTEEMVLQRLMYRRRHEGQFEDYEIRKNSSYSSFSLNDDFIQAALERRKKVLQAWIVLRIRKGELVPGRIIDYDRINPNFKKYFGSQQEVLLKRNLELEIEEVIEISDKIRKFVVTLA